MMPLSVHLINITWSLSIIHMLYRIHSKIDFLFPFFSVSRVCNASVSKHTLFSIQILSQYGGTESLKRRSFGNSRKSKVWRGGWALQVIFSITSWGHRVEENNLWFNGCFQICSADCTEERGINYMLVHTRWNNTLCWLYLISPRESSVLTLFSWRAIDKFQYLQQRFWGSERMYPYIL